MIGERRPLCQAKCVFTAGPSGRPSCLRAPRADSIAQVRRRDAPAFDPIRGAVTSLGAPARRPLAAKSTTFLNKSISSTHCSCSQQSRSHFKVCATTYRRARPQRPPAARAHPIIRRAGQPSSRPASVSLRCEVIDKTCSSAKPAGRHASAPLAKQRLAPLFAA